MDKDKLISLINQGEDETLELKSSFTKSVIETVVAFSNAKGGKVVIGINDKKEIVGVSVVEETIQKWINETIYMDNIQ